MAIQSQVFKTDEGLLSYPSTKHIATKKLAEIWLYKYATNEWILMNSMDWELINNSAVLNYKADSYIYQYLDLRVADTEDEMADSATDIAIIISMEDEIRDVASDPLRQAILDAHLNSDEAIDAANRAKESADNAKVSEDNAKVSEDNAKASEDSAKIDADFLRNATAGATTIPQDEDADVTLLNGHFEFFIPLGSGGGAGCSQPTDWVSRGSGGGGGGGVSCYNAGTYITMQNDGATTITASTTGAGLIECIDEGSCSICTPLTYVSRTTNGAIHAVNVKCGGAEYERLDYPSDNLGSVFPVGIETKAFVSATDEFIRIYQIREHSAPLMVIEVPKKGDITPELPPVNKPSGEHIYFTITTGTTGDFEQDETGYLEGVVGTRVSGDPLVTGLYHSAVGHEEHLLYDGQGYEGSAPLFLQAGQTREFRFKIDGNVATLEEFVVMWTQKDVMTNY